MSFRRATLITLILVFMLGLSPAGGVLAQGGDSTTPGDTSLHTLRVLEAIEIPARDAPDLAARLGGLHGASALSATPAPDYAVGDVKSFFVSHSDRDEVFVVEAVLAAEAPGVYLWVEQGIPYDALVLEQLAAFLDERLFPAVRELYGQEANPGIDGDPHIYILNVTNIGRSIGGYFNDNSVYPREIFSSSNEHEMFVVAIDNIPFYTSAYPYVLAHEFVHMIQHNQDENEQTWVTEGAAELGAFQTVGARLSAISYYLAAPATQLNSWNIDAPDAHYGAAALFFSYLAERFGEAFIRAHSSQPADGINGIEAALVALGAADPQTGEPVTFNAVFADWLVANLLNDRSLADGRYGYRQLDLGGSTPALSGRITGYPAVIQAGELNQFGAQYLRLESTVPRTLRLSFTGSAVVPIVPTDAFSGEHVYWANRSDQSNPRLTRAFDLRGVTQATLRFRTWYEMEPFWDYGYVSLSTDGGATWQPLETPTTLAQNPNNRAFAPGFTGFSVGGVDSRPAPYLGIRFDPLSGTVLDLIPGGGAASAGIVPGDRLVALDSITLDDPANLAALLNQYNAHDTVLFSIERDGAPLRLPVTLGEHPERTLYPDAGWAQESIDLTPYTGLEVLIRFEYVTDQAFTRNGWLLDDISIPEIGFFDDAESAQDWHAEGWARISNALPQDFLVQVITGAGQDVTRALTPGGGQTATWTLAIGPDTPATVIISGMTRYTTQPGAYTLRIDPVE